MVTTAALVVAAGRGHRFSQRPKQYADLCGRPLLAWTLSAFLHHPSITHLCVVIHPEDHEAFASVASSLGAPLDVVEGGPTRQNSVARGLEHLRSRTPDLVLIHDGARPCISRALIKNVVDTLQSTPYVAVVPLLPVNDSIKRTGPGETLLTVDRTDLYTAQTPQGFRFPVLLKAHDQPDWGAPDDISLLPQGTPIGHTEGCPRNLKVTLPKDMDTAKRYCGSCMRIGTGFDAHRTTPGNSLVLCGVRLPSSFSLEGYSDADVGLHALMDALLGAAALGDLGTHFSSQDPQWKGADSTKLLAYVVNILHKEGYAVDHVDVTLIGESPKVAPYRGAMREAVASALGLPLSRVSIKATTTDGLGFLGRGEGLCAQAVATVMER